MEISTAYKSFVPRPISIASGEAKATPQDTRWLEENIPCRTACPAHTDIPGYLEAIHRGEYDQAYRINLRDNVFPSILGRVCSRPCEEPCRHGWDALGESVAICFSKRSAADFRDTDRVVLPPIFPKSGKRVAIIGGGPAGLAAARNLTLLGHACTVFEKHSRPGGMMNQGIPEFRLPRNQIIREIEQIQATGVEIRCGISIGKDIPLEKLLQDYDAVIMAAGTLRPNFLGMDDEKSAGVHHGIPWLLQANEFHNAAVGDKVVVIGGGFTAMDCARTAYRLQLERLGMDRTNVRVCYRRSEKEMLVTPGEVEELAHESIPMEFMVGPNRYLAKDGQLVGMEFIRNALGEPDASGRRKPVAVKGSEFIHEADTILLATGQFPESSWIDPTIRKLVVGDDGWLLSGGKHATAIDKLFSAGDFSTGASTLIQAIGHAKETVRQVDRFLMGTERIIDTVLVRDGRPTPRKREFDFVKSNPMPSLPVAKRDLTAEVELGFDRPGAKEATSRCYFCHYKYEIDVSRCIKCNQCIEVMPRPQCIVRVHAVQQDEQGRIVGFDQQVGPEIDYNADFYINQQDCIRCNACLEVCPTQCISVQKVSGCVKAVGATLDAEASL